MLLLASTSDKIQLILATAVDVDVHASYIDYNGATVAPGRLNSKPATAATFDVVGSPSSGVIRNVKVLHFHNAHASSSVIITVQHTDGTNVVKLEVVNLLAGERLSYVEGQGFRLFDANAIEKTNNAGTVFTKVLSADQSNSTTSLTNVPGLEIPCGVGVWAFVFYIIHQSGATTTGLRFSVNHDGTVTAFVANIRFAAGTVAAADTHDQDQVTALIMSCFTARAKSTTGWGTTISVDATGDMLTIIEGSLVVSIAGNLELWHGSEVNAISTVKGGSGLILTRLG